MKIKDLPPEKNMGGVKFIYPSDGETYIWVSQWNKGVWGRKITQSDSDKQVHPLLFDEVKEVMEWEVVE